MQQIFFLTVKYKTKCKTYNKIPVSSPDSQDGGAADRPIQPDIGSVRRSLEHWGELDVVDGDANISIITLCNWRTIVSHTNLEVEEIVRARERSQQYDGPIIVDKECPQNVAVCAEGEEAQFVLQTERPATVQQRQD